MTRSELIKKLAQRFPKLTLSDVEVSVKVILSGIGDTLAKGERVEIREFGSFTIHLRPARLGRNPKTGERVPVPAKWVPYFRAGKLLKNHHVDRE